MSYIQEAIGEMNAFHRGCSEEGLLGAADGRFPQTEDEVPTDRGRRLPQTGRRFPQRGKMFPQTGRRLPQTGRRVLRQGRRFPRIERRLPQTGRSFL